MEKEEGLPQLEKEEELPQLVNLDGSPPLRKSSLKMASDPDRKPLSRKDSRVSIGETQIEEVSHMPFLRNSEWEPLPDVSQKVIIVTIKHTDDSDRPVISLAKKDDWVCTKGESGITVCQLTELLTEAMEAHEWRQRQDFETSRGTIGHGSKILMRAGTLKILSVSIAGEEEVDAFEDRPINIRDGGIVICHADLNEYEAAGGACMSCGCTMQ